LYIQWLFQYFAQEKEDQNQEDNDDSDQDEEEEEMLDKEEGETDPDKGLDDQVGAAACVWAFRPICNVFDLL
jgi:hypothetical protein